jgi:hypothetical protein
VRRIHAEAQLSLPEWRPLTPFLERPPRAASSEWLPRAASSEWLPRAASSEWLPRAASSAWPSSLCSQFSSTVQRLPSGSRDSARSTSRCILPAMRMRFRNATATPKRNPTDSPQPCSEYLVSSQWPSHETIRIVRRNSIPTPPYRPMSFHGLGMSLETLTALGTVVEPCRRGSPGDLPQPRSGAFQRASRRQGASFHRERSARTNVGRRRARKNFVRPGQDPPRLRLVVPVGERRRLEVDRNLFRLAGG